MTVSKEELGDLYTCQKMSIREIAKKLGLTRGQIEGLIEHYGIVTRTVSEAHRVTAEKMRAERTEIARANIERIAGNGIQTDFVPVKRRNLLVPLPLSSGSRDSVVTVVISDLHLGDSITGDMMLYYKIDGVLYHGSFEELFNNFNINNVENKIIMKPNKSLEVLTVGSFYGNRKTVKWGKVNYLIAHKTNKQCYSISLSSGRKITTTKDHSLFIESQKGRDAKTKPTSLINTLDRVWATSEMFADGNDDCIDEDFLKLCGMWVADGSYSVCTVAFSTGNDREFVEFIDNYCKKINKHYYVKSSGDLSINSIDLQRKMISLGFNGKCNTKEIPSWLMNSRDRAISAFLSGYFYGDGTIFTEGNGKIRIACGSINRKLIEQLRFLLWRLGIEHTMVIDKKHKEHSGFGSIYDNFYYIRINRLIEIKKFLSKTKTWNDISKIKIAKTSKSSPLHSRKVKEISKLEIKERVVYDLEIDGTHNFIANSVVCHNSNHLPQSYWSCISNAVEVLRNIKEHYNIKKVNLVLNGDIVSGRDVFRYQELMNLVQRGHWQVFLAEIVLKDTIKRLSEIHSVDNVVFLKGTHEGGAFNFVLCLKRMMDGRATYLSSGGVYDVGEPVGHYNVLFSHGYGWSDTTPISGPMLRDMMKAIYAYRENGIGVDRVCSSHSILGHRYVIVRNKSKEVKVLQIQEFEKVFPEGEWETLSLDVNGKAGWKKIYNCWSTLSDSNIYLLRSNYGETEVTSGHGVMIFEDDKIISKNAVDLKVGDLMICLKKIPVEPQVLNEPNDLLWLLGFYVAEGWASGAKQHSYSIGFCNKSKSFVEKCNELVSKYFDHSGKVFRRKNGLYQVTINSKKIYKFFKTNCEDSNGKIVPNRIFNLNEEQIKSFLNGYYCGDGTNYDHNGWSITSVDTGLLSGITVLLHMINGDIIDIGSKSHIMKRRRLTSYYFDKNKEAWHLSWTARFNGEKEFNDYIVVPIKEIVVKGNNSKVYDIEVEGTESFVDAQGMVLLHNSHWVSSNLEYGHLFWDCCGGFQKWELTIAQRPNGLIIYLFNNNEIVSIPIRPDRAIEDDEKSDPSLEYKNLVYYGSSLLRHLKEVESIEG